MKTSRDPLRARRMALPFEYAVRNLGRSPLRSVLAVSGSALVVLLVIGAIAFVRGMERSLRVTGTPGNVILLGAGSEESIERSQIDPSTAGIAAASLRGIRTRLGVPYVSPEVHAALPIRTAPAQEEPGSAVVRGVTAAAFLVHPQVRVLEGRAPEPGRNEVLAGRLLPGKLDIARERLAPGTRLWIEERPWTVSGIFEAPGTVMEPEIWMPLEDLQVLTQRSSLSCVVLTLDEHGPGSFADVEVFAASRLDLEITAIREVDYYDKLVAFFGPVRILVGLTAALAALGGVLGGLNTSYAAFASRVRELGTLQVLGFSRASIVVSLIEESALSACCGALAASAAGLLFLDGLTVKFSMGAFGLLVDGTVLALALASGVALGLAGALPPVLSALRLPIAQALRS